MAKGDIETYHEDGQWKNRREGSSRAFGVGDTKAYVQAAGREAAVRDSIEHIVKKQDGTIGEKSTYPRSRDPRSSNG